MRNIHKSDMYGTGHALAAFETFFVHLFKEAPVDIFCKEKQYHLV